MTNQQNETLYEFWQTVDQHLIRYTGKFSPVVIHHASGAYIYDHTGRAILVTSGQQQCYGLPSTTKRVLVSKIVQGSIVSRIESPERVSSL